VEQKKSISLYQNHPQMNVEDLREYCIKKAGVTEEFPFGNDTLVFKVQGKIFALISLDGPTRINLKSDPEKALELRAHFNEVVPGYHMNKKHWNSVYYETIPDKDLQEWIDHSYKLVFDSLPKKLKDSL
jgi:predicted DNA-binding protein (MmcQ/YjbR family)